MSKFYVNKHFSKNLKDGQPCFCLCLPQVRIPSTPSMLFNLYYWNCDEKRTKMNKKEAGIGPFFKKNLKDFTFEAAAVSFLFLSSSSNLSLIAWREPWSSGYGRRLTFQRLCVQIPTLYTGWTCHFFTHSCCKNCNEECFKRPKINEKEAGMGHLKK